MKWIIGKTYKTRNGQSRKLLAFTSKGRLVIEDEFGSIATRYADGRTFEKVLSPGDLISNDPTPEEREFVARMWDIIRRTGVVSGVGDEIRNTPDYFDREQNHKSQSLLGLVREIRNSSK